VARAHPEQHVPIQFTLHRDHPLFRFLEQERAHLGQSRAGYVRWLLEQQFLRVRAAGAAAPTVAASTPVSAASVAATGASSTTELPVLEPDDDLLASFLS
jgi:hypothetical protein